MYKDELAFVLVNALLIAGWAYIALPDLTIYTLVSVFSGALLFYLTVMLIIHKFDL